MRQRGGIDHGAVSAARKALYRIHESALVVGLKPLDFHIERPGGVADHGLDLSQAGSPVDLRFPLPQEVQIGAVEHGDAHSALKVLQPGLKLVEIVFPRIAFALTRWTGWVRLRAEKVVK